MRSQVSGGPRQHGGFDASVKSYATTEVHPPGDEAAVLRGTCINSRECLVSCCAAGFPNKDRSRNVDRSHKGEENGEPCADSAEDVRGGC